MKPWIVSLLLILNLSLAASGSEPTGTSWLRVASGSASTPYESFSSFMYCAYDCHGWSSSRKFDQQLLLDVCYEQLFHECLAFSASIAHARGEIVITHDDYGDDDPEETVDAGTFAVTPVMAGVVAHPFKVHRLDLFLGLEVGMMFTSSMGYIGDDAVEEADVDDPLVWGYNAGISLRIGNVRAFGVMKSFRGLKDITPNPEEPDYKIEGDGAVVFAELGLAIAL